jgi:UPF0716 family protein affecting phage T7 exclusion
MNVAIEIIGWSGAVLIVTAYAQAARGRWPATGTPSAVINVVAGLCLVINGAYHGAYPSVGLNSMWTVIGALALMRSGRDLHHRARRRRAQAGP